MDGRIMKKIRGRSGETIAETLIALLISALALLILSGAINTAGTIIKRSDAIMTDYYAKITDLGNPSSTDKLTIIAAPLKDLTGPRLRLTENGGDAGTDPAVDYAVNDAFPGKPVYSYRLKPSA